MSNTKNGLVRIICLDAHVPGKLMAINVDEHANLSGTNGAGKTTLLKLAPFFYGASPTDVIPRKSTRTRFVDYYLPRRTSMIIYEYRTERKMMCAVAYRHSSGEKPAYRFLAEGFCDDYFCEMREGKRCYVEGRELGRLWNTNHLEHSKQIELTVDYRAVIQGDAELINRSGDKELRRLAAQFSLTGKIGKIRYIDKMATAILGRSGNMDRIKSMLADIMQEDNVIPPSINLHRGIKNEISSLSILRDLDRHADLFHSVIAKGISYQENAKSIGYAHAELSNIKQVLVDRITEGNNTLNNLDETLSANAAIWDKRSFELKDKASNAEASVGTLERQLNSLNDVFQRWEDSSIHTKRADYDQLERFKELYESARIRLVRLEEGVQDISRQFNESIAQEEKRHHKVTISLNDKIREFENKINDIKARWADRKVEITQKLSQEKDDIHASYQEELDRIRNDIAKTHQESKYSHTTEEEKIELDLAEADRDEAEDHVDTQTAICVEEHKTLDTLSAQRLSVDRDLNQAARDVDSLSKKHDEMLLLCRPVSGSVLAELRDKQPDWHDTVGRVIRPELLTRKDLSPFFIEQSSENFFGWQLALDRIDKPEWASNLEEQEQRLKLCENDLDLAESFSKECELRLSKANKAVAEQRGVYEEEKRKLARLKASYKSASDAVKRTKSRNAEAAVNRKLEAKIKLERLKITKQDAEARIKQAIGSAEKRSQSIINEGMSALASEESSLNNEAGAYRGSLEAEGTTHKLSIKTLKSDYDAQRSEQGLDEKVIQEAESSVKNTREDVKRIEGYAIPVAEYCNWIERDWSNYNNLTESLAEIEATRDYLKQQINNELALYKNQRDTLRNKKSTFEKSLTTDRNNSNECSSLQQRLFPPVSPINIDNPRNIDIVLADGQMLIEERLELKKAIRHGVTKAESLILKGGDDSQIATAWQALVQLEKNKLSVMSHEDIDEELLTLNKTMALDELLRVQLTQLRESLILFIENIGHQITQYYLGMRDISSAIKSQSRQISEAIGNTLHFEAISEVKVSLKSRIDNEDFWPVLKTFYETWSSWKEAGDSSIPPAEVDQQLMRATEILGRSNVKRPLSGLFELEISLCENGRWVTARRAEELEDASSTGLSYLILCCIYAGISRMLCRDKNLNIHWPMDELGTLAPENITRLFSMLDEYGIVMIGGFPTTDPTLLQHFKYHHDVQTSGGIVEMSLPEDELALAIAERCEMEA